MTSKMSKYGTPKLNRANFEKELERFLEDYFGEVIYYETETFDGCINYNIGIPTDIMEVKYWDEEIRVGGEYINRENDIQSTWK